MTARAANTTTTAMPAPQANALLAVSSLAFACVALDNTKLLVGVPTLASTGLHGEPLGSAALGWIVEANLISYTTLLLFGGTLTERWGPRRTLLIGLALFSLASLAAALAPGLPTLLGARVLVGAGAALMTPASLATLKHGFATATRARAVAVWTASFGVAAALGPLLGGLLLEAGGWRALLLGHLPCSGLAWIGVLCSVPSVSPRRSPIRALPSTAPAALLGAPRFRRTLLVILLGYFAFSGLGCRLTQAWQLERAHSPGAASLYNLPLPLALLAGTLLAPGALRRWGAERALRRSLLLAALGAGLVGFAAAWGSDRALAAALVPFALGCGSAFASATERVLAAVTEERAGSAAALSETAFELGGVFGVALLGTGVWLRPLHLETPSTSSTALAAAGALLLAWRWAAETRGPEQLQAAAGSLSVSAAAATRACRRAAQAARAQAASSSSSKRAV